MIIKTDVIKPACSTILSAVDSSDLSAITETLELKAVGDAFQLNVTNREYYVRVKLALSEPETFNATVNAILFLKLVAQITSEFIDLSVDGNSLVVKGNGVYKLPLIFDNDKLLALPEIEITNATAKFDIATSILNSILNYNTKELSKGKDIQKRLTQQMYYIDENGCITFVTGACVNNFTLPQPIKLLLNQKLVKLFKLFKGENVGFTLGYDALDNGLIQTKVRFETNGICVTSILSCDDTLLNSVPVVPIRNRATNTYPHSIVVSKDAVLQAINRIMLFANNKDKVYSTFTYDSTSFTMALGVETTEVIPYANGSNVATLYTNTLDLVDLKLTLESCSEQFININFGDGKAVVIARGNVYNVIPEVVNE